MDSTRIRSLATGARDQLRLEVSARLDAALAEGSAARVDRPGEVSALERRVREEGRDAVVDSAAYTWFNRLCALRYMDARGHTPTPVVTPRPGSTRPAVLEDAASGVFDLAYGFPGAAMARVRGLLAGTVASDNAAEDAYAELLSAVCAHYAASMGYLFSADRASSLLMPRGMLSQGSILERIVSGMDDGACSSVEVLGWLYQFYVAERKDEVFAGFKRGRKAGAAEIGPATQLFTPEWIVRYLAENSLGRLWVLNDPGSGLAEGMDYCIAPEGDEPHATIGSAEDIRVLDPACGSGHILTYCFDLLFRMYREEGWPDEDIPQMILENNLYGLEIDPRAAEIASFALEMRALEHDPNFLERRIDAHIHVLDPVALTAGELARVPGVAARPRLLDAMAHLGECGSLYVPDPLDAGALRDAVGGLDGSGDLHDRALLGKLSRMLSHVGALSATFHCVVANPPYMGAKNMGPWLAGWVKANYPDEKGDLCTCFVKRGLRFAGGGGYAAEVTMQSWMFLGSYEGMRQGLISSKRIATMTHLGTRAFEAIGGEVVSTTATVLQNAEAGGRGAYVRLVDYGSEAEKAAALREAARDPGCGWLYRADAADFAKVPGAPIAYWASEAMLSLFDKKSLESSVAYKEGITTGDNSIYLRYWMEVSRGSIDLDGNTPRSEGRTWIPCNKGGGFRKWYGNRLYVIDWTNDGEKLKSFRGSSFRNSEYQRREGATYSNLSSASLSTRISPVGTAFESKGTTYFAESRQRLYEVMAYMNSSLFSEMLKMVCPTLDFKFGTIQRLPDLTLRGTDEVVGRCVEVAQSDYDAFETSWDFSTHPLVRGSRVADAWALWEAECRGRFDSLKSNEEELNRTFAAIYHMEGEVPVEVQDNRVSVRLADRDRDARSLVSYGVGCMLGRYSAERPGLVLADQGATLEDFRAKVPGARFLPDADNVLPVTEGEWFEDDAVTGFRRWLASAYGPAHLQENVAWLEESLGEDLRAYLRRDFYADHLRTYQKRPIYWVFRSPKGTFQCVCYMHRYAPGLVGTILTGYLRPMQAKLSARLASLDVAGATAAQQREATRLRQQLDELSRWEHDVIYDLAQARVEIDLDDGVKVNYNKFPDALAKIPGLSEWK